MIHLDRLRLLDIPLRILRERWLLQARFRHVLHFVSLFLVSHVGSHISLRVRSAQLAGRMRVVVLVLGGVIVRRLLPQFRRL